MSEQQANPGTDTNSQSHEAPADPSNPAGGPEQASDPVEATELDLTAGGVWAIRSTSATVLFVDLDARLLLRQHGPGSPRGPNDGRWVPLVRVSSQRGDTGVIRVGDRHEFLTDPDGGFYDYQWWIPRACTRIERVSDDLRTPGN